ncbi:hypothetical protein NPIL_395421 [Nephila pilipes]|uniref:Uncharacterized protein n=1 Tax=Nephila pilipes TaxID=299642 RepID=A0A8X6K287_NEPPI|nr:hypothetical protein NPIL_395421 [Nephila pilipes]
MTDSSLTDCEQMTGTAPKNHEKVMMDINHDICNEKDYVNPTDHENMTFSEQSDFDETTDCEMSDSDEMTDVGQSDCEESASTECEKQESHTFDSESIATEDVYNPAEFEKRINPIGNTEEQQAAEDDKDCITCPSLKDIT